MVSGITFTNYPSRRPWLINPVADLILLCGGGLWLLLTVSIVFGISADWLLLGAILITAPHFGAPILNAAKSRTWIRHMASGPLMFIGITAGTCVLLFVPNALGYALSLYLVAVLLHYAFQNVAVMKLYLRRANYPISPIGSVSLTWLIPLLTLTVLLQQFQSGSGLTQFLGTELPQMIDVPSNVVVAIDALCAYFGLVFLIDLMSTFLCTARTLPFSVMLLLFTTIAILVLSGGQMSGIFVLFMPAFLHGLQSVSINSWVNIRNQHGKQTVMVFLSQAFLLGLTIMYASPMVFDYIGVPEQRAYSALLVVFSFHHFALEAVLFKLARKM